MTEDQYDRPQTGTADQASMAAAVGSVATDLRDAAAQKIDETVTAVKSGANDAKASVADEVKDVALALRRASEQLRGGSAQERTIGMVANGLADASDALRDKDLGEMLKSANQIARENPLVFLGGAVLLGFAASRFAKAGSDLPRHQLTAAGRYHQDVARFAGDGNPNVSSSDELP